ncbi:hypothetical protein, partial [Rhodopirellula bahusiensis]|uniref:hypothetical protein n=1 Tax=Rhodopirellula bahusiensis TaxID=2014065 RepID=UPI0032994B0A
ITSSGGRGGWESDLRDPPELLWSSSDDSSDGSTIGSTNDGSDESCGESPFSAEPGAGFGRCTVDPSGKTAERSGYEESEDESDRESMRRSGGKDKRKEAIRSLSG